jgi:hypothetical protein
MKATVEIPDALFQVIHAQAQQRGQNFDSTMAEILERGIAESVEKDSLSKPILSRHPETGLPVIMGGRRPLPGQELTPEQIDEILLKQEVEWHREASGH